MDLASTTLVYFSATGTTRRVARAIAEGLHFPRPPVEVDLTRPGAREAPAPDVAPDSVLVVATPVYEHRPPRLLYPYLKQLRGTGPVVVVAVYGNVSPGGTLGTLAKFLRAGGFKVVAGGTFVAEHSFCHAELLVAPGRPDARDLAAARGFGEKVRRKLDDADSLAAAAVAELPGKTGFLPRLMPKIVVRLATWAPAIDREACIKCGACVEACPTGAIDPASLAITERACRRCFACVRACPAGARQIRVRRKRLVHRFFKRAMERAREPRTYL